MSSSKSKQQTINETQQLNLQGVDGIAVAGKTGDISIAVTDGGAVASMRGVSADALDAMSRSTGASVEAMRRSVSDAFYFGGDALDAMRRTSTESVDAMRRTTGDALSANTSVSRDALGTNERISRDAVSEAAKISRQALDVVESQGRTALNVAEYATRNALDFATNATRPEGGQTVDVVKWGAGAAVAVALIMAMRG